MHSIFHSPFRFLGTVDKLGTGYSDPVIATGYGAYMATPILRKAYEENKEMTKEQAVELLYKVMQVLFYRDARSFPKVCYIIISEPYIYIILYLCYTIGNIYISQFLVSTWNNHKRGRC